MNRKIYFDYIEEKLSTLETRITNRGKLNILDIHLHSENFYLYFFNLLYGFNLKNLNTKLQNVASIDLIDYTEKIIFQVSATSTKQKIELSLNKDIIKDYNNYTFKFIFISKDASELRTKKYKNPNEINFDPMKDIYDIPLILKVISSKSIEEMRGIYDFIQKELGGVIDVIKLDSNLATIINILSKEKWDDVNKTKKVDAFEIERKITYNELNKAKGIIEEYFVYHKKIDEKYSEFDKMGVNKSNSVLASIRREYLKCKKELNSDEIYLSVVENVKAKIINSSNFKRIPIDELELCVDILVVDAFTRCKIFENPERYNYVDSR